MNVPLNRRIMLTTLVIVAVLSVSGVGAAAPADSTSSSTTEGPLFQVQPEDIDNDDEATDDGASENSTDTEPSGEDDGLSIDITDSAGNETNSSTGDPSGETAATEKNLDNLPIEADEDDVDLTETGNETAGGDSGGTPQVGGGGTGGIGPSLSPEENAEDLAEWLVDRMYNATVRLIDDVFNNMLGTPVPENDGWQGILGQPVGETYGDLYEEVYMQMILPPVFQFMILGFIGFVLFVVPFSPITGRRVWSVLFAMFGAAALVLFAWNFASLLHHVSDAVTMWFLPQGEEVLADANGESILSEENIGLASGPLGVFLGVYFASWNVGIGLLLIHGMRQAVLFFMPTVLPIILVGMYFGPQTSKAAFSVLFWQYIGLLVMNWPTALLLSIAYHVNFDFGMGEVGSLPNLAVTIGLFIFAIGIPLLVQSSFLGGSLVAIATKGSVLSAGTSTARKYVPSGSIGSAARSAAKRGGGYINPVSRYTHDAGTNHKQQQHRQDAASRVTSLSPHHGRTVTDGGHASRSDLHPTSKHQTAPSTQNNASPTRSIPASSTRDAGSVDARRRERYRRLRGSDSS